jgi:hypothetical protein
MLTPRAMIRDKMALLICLWVPIVMVVMVTKATTRLLLSQQVCNLVDRQQIMLFLLWFLNRKNVPTSELEDLYQISKISFDYPFRP